MHYDPKRTLASRSAYFRSCSLILLWCSLSSLSDASVFETKALISSSCRLSWLLSTWFCESLWKTGYLRVSLHTTITIGFFLRFYFQFTWVSSSMRRNRSSRNSVTASISRSLIVINSSDLLPADDDDRLFSQKSNFFGVDSSDVGWFSVVCSSFASRT